MLGRWHLLALVRTVHDLGGGDEFLQFRDELRLRKFADVAEILVVRLPLVEPVGVAVLDDDGQEHDEQCDDSRT